jgi:hypothetical protein
MIVKGETLPAKYSPYSNICPISGWDEANVRVVGKNWLNANTSYNVVADSTWINTSCDLPIGTYTFSYKASRKNGQITFNVYNANDERILNIGGISNSDPKITFTINERGARISSYSNSTLTISDLQIELDSTVTTYEPYNGQTYTIDLDGTRYGGKLDVVSGIVTPAPYYASYNGEALTGEWISDRDKYEVGTTPTIGAQVVNIGASDTPVSLTPTIIKSLQGENNLFADSGEVIKLQYWGKEQN